MAKPGKDNMAMIKIGGAALALLVAVVLLLQFLGVFGGASTPTLTAEQEAARNQAAENARKAQETQKAEGAERIGG